MPQPKCVPDVDARTGRDGTVVTAPAPRDEIWSVSGTHEVRPGAVAEACLGDGVEAECDGEVGRIEQRQVEFEEAPHDEGVVVEQARHAGLGCCRRAVPEAAVRRLERRDERVAEVARGRDEIRVEPARGNSERGEHEAVAVGERLVVQAGARARGAGREKPGAEVWEARVGERRLVGAEEDVRAVAAPRRLVDERALSRRPEGAAGERGEVGRERGVEVGLAPDVEGAFVERAVGPKGVGVLGRREESGRQAEVANRVPERVERRLAQVGLARRGMRLGTGEREERLVGEHLLEVRQPPRAVGRVAVQAAADGVGYPAPMDGSERARGEVRQTGVAGLVRVREEEEGVVRSRKLGRAAESAVLGIGEAPHRRRRRRRVDPARVVRGCR